MTKFLAVIQILPWLFMFIPVRNASKPGSPVTLALNHPEASGVAGAFPGKCEACIPEEGTGSLHGLQNLRAWRI